MAGQLRRMIAILQIIRLLETMALVLNTSMKLKALIADWMSTGCLLTGKAIKR